jgi:hypothetical protein
MQDNPNFLKWNTLIFQKWQTTSTFLKIEEDFNLFAMEEDPVFFKYGRQPQLIGK